MSNILIVEGDTDKIFIETLIEVMNENSEYKIEIDDCRVIGGLDSNKDSKKIKTALKILKEEAGTPSIGIPKIGIILDVDTFSIEERLQLLNECVNEVFKIINAQLNIGDFFEVTNEREDELEITCFFMNVNGQGELSTVLKAIKAEEYTSIYADCIESWKNCVEQFLENNEKIIVSKNEFDKHWVYNYIYYDISNKKHSFNKKGFKYIMQNKRDIWNFENTILENLKIFLALFETGT